MTLRNLLASALFLASAPLCNLSAQNRPVGFWRAHLPYNNALGVATDGTKLFAISEKGFFSFDPSSDSYERFSKVEGLHETGTTAIAYDRPTGTCIIGYANSNIDLYRNNNFKVMPELKNKSFAGSKAINMIYTRNGFAYVSSGLGLVIIDLDKEEVRETYTFTKNSQVIGVNSFTADDTHFYMATTAGLYRSLQTNPTPQILSSWQLLDSSRRYTRIATAGTNAIFPATSDSLFRVSGTGIQFVWRPDSAAVITSLSGSAERLYAGRFTIQGAGRSYHFNLSNQIVDSSNVAYPRGTVETLDGNVWHADQYQGLAVRNRDNAGLSLRVPQGPNSPQNFGLTARNNQLWVAHGGYNAGYNQNLSNSGMSGFKDENWRTYQLYNFDLFRDSVRDILSFATNPANGNLYAATYNSGLIELRPDGSGQIFKQGKLQFSTTTGGYPASSVAVDSRGNVWTTQTYAPYDLAVRSASTGEWSYLQPLGLGRSFRINLGLLIDDFDQKWYFSPVGGGVLVYDDRGTPENPADDPQPTRLTFGANSGNLPDQNVRSMMKDRDGAIWVGTDNGIGIFNNPSGVLNGSGATAELRTVQYDQFAGKLFSGESVRAMAVDGGNRKWIGTTNGVWLLSPDALKIIERFTVENSPLPSNNIQSIAVDPVTGDVYIGTDEGLVSWRGTSTEGGTDNTTLQTFPNPVPSGYGGTISIRGFVEDADVRITDVTGQLIYKTRAAGGQATWNGMDYTGARPATGVYLIFATDRTGTKATTGKFMFMH